MPNEEELIKVRQTKHQEINNGNYPTSNSTNNPIRYILGLILHHNPPISLNPSELGDDFIVNGRISLFRKSGGISFIKLTDDSGSIQLIFSKKVLSDYDKIKLLDLGDIVNITGKICYSMTQEPSILVTSWKLLTKAIKPPPEKFNGIADTELKYRKRYLDLISSEESRAVFKMRSAIIQAIRAVMDNKGFMEVETSTLSTINSGATAKPFTTHHNALNTDLYLRIAPELNLKRLLVGGFEKVFEIGKSYRNEGLSTRHNPEFTMLEFYQAYGNFSNLIQSTSLFLRKIESYAKDYAHIKDPDIYSNFYSNWENKRTFTLQEHKELSMWDSVVHGCAKAQMFFDSRINLFLNDLLGEEVKDMEIMRACERQDKINIVELNKALKECKNNGERIGVLFEYVAEPFLVEDYRTEDGRYSLPVYVTQYPSVLCPLARPNDNNPNICDRFELFIDGKEIANAYQELNDPKIQAAKFQEQLGNKEAMDFDKDYVEALEYGMPPAIGFGMGIDRLVMLLTNRSSIKDVILFPTMKLAN